MGQQTVQHPESKAPAPTPAHLAKGGVTCAALGAHVIKQPPTPASSLEESANK
jgi:hypothetical protein